MGGHRRHFLVGGATATATVGGGTLLWFQQQGYRIDPSPYVPKLESPPIKLPGAAFDLRAERTLRALYAYLIPGDPELGLPSADEAEVMSYVQKAMTITGLRPVRDDLLKLARWLDSQVRPHSFAEIEPAQGTQVLLETQAHHEPIGRFRPAIALEAALRIGLEGYLGHSEHGGNPKFVTWSALKIAMPHERRHTFTIE